MSVVSVWRGPEQSWQWGEGSPCPYDHSPPQRHPTPAPVNSMLREGDSKLLLQGRMYRLPLSLWCQMTRAKRRERLRSHSDLRSWQYVPWLGTHSPETPHCHAWVCI